MARYFSRFVSALVMCAAFSAPQAWAGGLFLYEIGTQDVGSAAAGYAARAQDASTVFTNPAGMTRLKGTNVLMGAQALYDNAVFTQEGNDGTTPQGGGNGGTAIGWVPGGSFFLTQQVGDKVAIGVGTFSYFGAAVDYHDSWAGRYYVQDATLAGLSLMPAIALKLSDKISVGAGLNIMYGMLEDKKAINNIDPETGDGRLELKDDEFGYGASVGILLELSPDTRIGMTYLSKIDLDFSDTPEFTNLGPGLAAILNERGLTNAKIDLGIEVPQSFMLSLYQKLGEKFALMANLGLQDWSSFGKVDVSIDSDDPRSLTTDIDFKDTWHVALGGQYQYTPEWLLCAGISYDSPMLDNDVRGPALPVGETWRYGVGAQYLLNERTRLGFDYEYAWSGDLGMHKSSPLAGDLSGTYKDTYIQVAAFNVALSF